MNPERNDVDIEKLFSWGKKFTIKTTSGEDLEVYIKVIGDADMNRARVFGLRESAYLRNKLADKNSDERLAYMVDSTLPKEKLVDTIIMYRMRDYRREIVKEVKIKPPKELKPDATLEQQEKHQAEIDSYPEKIRKEVEKRLVERIDRDKKFLTEQPEKELYDEYEKLAINDLCESEMYNKFREIATYFGTYLDSNYRVRFFNDYETFANLPSQVKGQLMGYYDSLGIEMEELKK